MQTAPRKGGFSLGSRGPQDLRIVRFYAIIISGGYYDSISGALDDRR